MSTEAQAGRIVVGVDGSAGSIRALREADRIARGTGAWLDVVSCWDVPSNAPRAVGMIADEIEEVARQRLQENVASTLGSPVPENVSTSLVRGQAQQKLIELSDGSDMLVVGRRGFGSVAGLFMGSVSQACVGHAHCPVLVVNADRINKSLRDVAS
ncbi:MAG: universal stress protein [Specibacter sp.]